MPKYAAGTEVPVDRSRSQIEAVLRRYGATQFAYGWDGQYALIGFVADDRQVRFALLLPHQDDPEFWLTPGGRDRTERQAHDEYDKETRRRWRSLLLVIKAKLEAVESGIAEFESEFLAYIVLPDGSVVGDHARGAIAKAYETGQVPSLLPGHRPTLDPPKRTELTRGDT